MIWCKTVLIAVLCTVGAGLPAWGQVRPNDTARATGIKMNLANEVELKTLTDYVSERIGINIIYDEKISGKKIILRAPNEIPAESLLDVLQSALKAKGLLLVDDDTTGWKRVVETERLAGVSESEANPASPGLPITQTFTLQYADVTQLVTSLSPFLTTPGGNAIALKDQRMLIVTDYAGSLARIARLVELIDQPRPASETKTVLVDHVDATSLADRLSELLEARSKAEGLTENKPVGVAVFPDARTNQLIIIGRRDRIAEVEEMIRVLDVSLQLTTEVYTPQILSAERLEKMARNLVPVDDRKRLFQSIVDNDENMVVITTTREIHEKLARLAKQLDVGEQQQAKSRIRFYKLKYTSSEAALETLRGIEGKTQTPSGSNVGPLPDGNFRLLSEVSTIPGVGGGNTRFQPTTPPAGLNFPNLGGNNPLNPGSYPGGGLAPQTAFPPGAQNQQQPLLGNLPQNGDRANSVSLESVLGRARVTADVNSNTLIVIGDPSAQALYSELIEKIDQPRPQVLIEAKVIVLDTSDGFQLGVDSVIGDRSGSKKLFAFNSFGLSKADAVTGALSVIPGTGFNGALVDPDIADVVIRAFTNHRRAKVVSSPRVMVSDNSTGVLSSVTEVPFTNVNASQTVSTTSFGGFAKAGTTIRVLPHISAKDQLQLDFTVTLNDFTGPQSNPAVPPPRETDEIASQVTVPDGHTLIVGGLNRVNATRSVESLPFVELIPIVRYAFSNNTKSQRETSLFIFIKPIILREDKFRDLKYLSDRDLTKAQIFGNFPASQPRSIR